MTNAHITSQGDSIHSMLSTGELFIGMLDEIAALLLSLGIAAGDITMPKKNDPESPSTGQRIAIYHALHSDEIEERRKRQEGSNFGIADHIRRTMYIDCRRCLSGLIDVTKKPFHRLANRFSCCQ